jgi:hypothetical protein
MPEREGPPAPPREVNAPDLSTTLGAAMPRDGLDFTRDVDTSGLSLTDPNAPTAGEQLRNQPTVDNTEAAARFQGARELRDLHQQVTRGLLDAGVELARPLSREEFAATPEGKGKKGQALALAHRQYMADPETQRDVMRRDAEAFDALQQAKAAEDAAAQQPRNPLPEDTLRVEPTPSTAMADAMTRAIKKSDEERAAADTEAKKARETDAIANVTKGAQLADDAEAGRVQGDPNAPKPREEIERDWHAAMEANDMDTKRQSLVPFMKRMATMGVDKMATHAEQIAALDQIAGDKKASQGMRDRASMLAEQWRKELPQEEKAPVGSSVEQAPAAEVKSSPEAPAQVPAAVDATLPMDGKAPVETAKALGENIPAKAAPDNAAPSAKLEAATASLPDNTAPAKPLTVAEQRDARMQQAEARAAKVASRRGDAGVTDKTPLIPEGTPVTDRAEALGDRVAALRAEFSARLRAGEKLTPLEQERYDDLGAFAQTLNRYTEGRAKPSDEEFVKSVGQMVETASAPYTKSLRKELN